MDVEKYKAIFLKESQSHLVALQKTLASFKKNDNHAKLFKEIYLSIHTLKSLAGTMKFHESAKVCKAVEDFLDKNRNVQIQKYEIILREGLNYLQKNLNSIISQNKEVASSSFLASLKKY